MNGTNTIVDYLTSVPAWYLATCEGDQPHVRPFSFAAVQDGHIWFCTATTKDVYRELEANPKFELTAWKPGSGWVIMRGKAVLKDEANEDVRRAGYEHMTGLGESYEGPGDETLTFFTVSEPEAWLCDAFEHVDRGVRLPAFDIDEVLAANAHHEGKGSLRHVSFRAEPRDIGSELSF